MTQHRKHRGYASQRIVADYLRTHGFPFAEPEFLRGAQAVAGDPTFRQAHHPFNKDGV